MSWVAGRLGELFLLSGWYGGYSREKKEREGEIVAKKTRIINKWNPFEELRNDQTTLLMVGNSRLVRN